MKHKLLYYLRTYPVFVWLLPVFFVLHGYTEFYNLIPLNESLKLTGIYLVGALILYGISWIVFRNNFKTSIFVFLLLAFNFFFGPVHDMLKKTLPGSLITRYVFLLPSILIFFIVLIIILRKSKKKYTNITLYLNSLLIILLLVDAFKLALKNSAIPNKTDTIQGFSSCNDCDKPDIYFILADGYAGQEELTDIFHFDNSAFENELKNRGFHITQKTKGNYNSTPFVMASMLNMKYVRRSNESMDLNDLKLCLQLIEDAEVFKFLKNNGYKIYNYSIFGLPHQPALTKPTFLPGKTQPLITQTFLYRIQHDLWFHLVTDFNLKSAIRGMIYHDKKNNQKLIGFTKEIVLKKTNTPKFVYTHLVMPHFPYYYNSKGDETPYTELGEGSAGNQNAYIEYLQYCNKVLLDLVDHIKTNSAKPPIIILMGDHGFREFKTQTDEKYHFMNFNSVYFPDSNYIGFYNGMTNVNQFRVILNNRFKQNLQMLKDSTIFIK